ncbi:DNA polymerase III [Listeria monocytogenes serotype 1/2a]|nr:DNA polymerase III [Listeria monocytogenes serotype 1/2a]
MVLQIEDKYQHNLGDFVKLKPHPVFKLFILDTTTKYNELSVLLQQKLSNVLREDKQRLDVLENSFKKLFNKQEIKQLRKEINANEYLLSTNEFMLENSLPNIQYRFNLDQTEVYDSSQLFKDLDAKLAERFQEVRKTIEISNVAIAIEELSNLEDDILVFYKNEKNFDGYRKNLDENIIKEVSSLVKNIKYLHFKDSQKMEGFYPSSINEQYFIELAISSMHEITKENKSIFGAYSLDDKKQNSIEIEKKIMGSAWCQYNDESKEYFEKTMKAVRIEAKKTLSAEQDKFIHITNIFNCVVTGQKSERSFDIPDRESFSFKQNNPIQIKKLYETQSSSPNSSKKKEINNCVDRI